MDEAIGQVLVFAAVAALSPIPIIGVVLMLGTPHARVNGPAFVAGWLLGLAAVGAIVLLVAPESDADGSSSGGVRWVRLLLGLLLVALALKQWRDRPRDGEPAPTPAWMAEVERFGAWKAAAAGAAFSAVNPKNLVLAVAAAAAISQVSISGGEQAVAYAIFALLSTVGVALPVVLYFALGERAASMLERLEGWLAQHNAVIMTVLLLVIGVKLIGDALSGV
jgi:threonine/homoserine/homoserine lactone efflux protein